jgi:2-polyprenyl-3-methyl-5-hydroxy-6-metoxy-1,4-benzoquinol methylase
MSGIFEKPWLYYTNEREDLLSLVPRERKFKHVLDVGCGCGANASLYRKMGAEYIVGIEIDPTASAKAREIMDYVIEDSIENFENLPFEDNFFDLVVCADILEHLYNPWQTLEYTRKIMRDEALLLLSIPNIRYYRTIIDLIVKGTFTYTQSGILDVTHLRFFTKNEIAKLLLNSGFTPIKWSHNKLGLKKTTFDIITLRLFHDFLIYQHYCLAEARK